MNKYTISDATEKDAELIGPMHLKAWHESYINSDYGVDGDFIDEIMGKVATKAGTEFRQKRIAEAKAAPNMIMYRVVKDHKGEVVGFFIAEKKEAFNELQAIYLLDSAKGSGVADELMKEYLEWIDHAKRSQLQAAAYNKRASSFYERYGFRITKKKLPLHHDKMPLVEMVRKADKAK